jgi:PIN domain nuclease of toxin-antitoxin system
MANRASGRLILLDTHVWIWAIEQDRRLKREHEKIIEENAGQVFVCAASLWEVSMLVSKKRMKLIFPLREWLEFGTVAVGLPVLPITTAVAAEAYELPGTFHDDPADRLIVATARVHKCLLLTEDSKILDYSHVKTT